MSRELIVGASEEQRLTEAAKRIRAMWSGNKQVVARGQRLPKVRMNSNLTGNTPSGTGTYSGSDISNTSSDFLGDWRSADGWMRFDMLRVRNRSRQLERGNPWCSSFKISLLNNVLGANGLYWKPLVTNSVAIGDTTEGSEDVMANAMLKAARAKFEKAENFTTRKRLDRIDADRLLLSRLCFDGEIILRKVTGFDNEFGFSWQIIDPDYLDHNLNRLEPNGNFTKMGVELDKDYKFPVAYWFLHRRPNDYFYNYANYKESLYYRVEAKDIMHIFVQTDDSEQTRGWPWLFSASVNLFRMGKYEEAALVNATIGASKMGFFKKTVPDGFTGDPTVDLEDDGSIVDEVDAGTWWELPWNVEPVPFNPSYPDAEFDPFSKAMLRGIAAAAGTSYMSLTGDLSEANFSNMRAGKNEENEQWMALQGYLIRKWKKPEYEEWVYRALVCRVLKLPIDKLDKFTVAKFRGRRWPYVNPIDDRKANLIAFGMRTKSITQMIEEQDGDMEPSEVFNQIAKDDAVLLKLGIPVLMGELNMSQLLTEQGIGTSEDDKAGGGDAASKRKIQKKQSEAGEK